MIKLPRMSWENSADKLGQLCRRCARLRRVLRPNEKRTIILMAVIIFGALLWHMINSQGSNPAYGGTYVEGFVGEAKYINPVLASSEVDQSLVKLIYSGLTRIDDQGDVLPDLCTSWEVGGAGKTYTFHLRNDVAWHDGSKFTAKDVVYTIRLVQNPNVQSWHYDTWKDITITAPDDYTVVFTLPNPSSAFIWNTTLGIMPAKIGDSDINQSFIGTGLYKYSKVRVRENKIESIVLVRNTKTYLDAPYIDAVEMWLFNSLDEAKTALQNQKIQAIAKTGVGDERDKEYQMKLNQKITLFLNTQSAFLSDVTVRQKLLAGELASISGTLTVVVDSAHASDVNVKNILNQWQANGIKLVEQNMSLTAIKSTVLTQHNYDVIILAVEDGPQFDYYAYWHSSQADNGGLNFARLKNTDLDKLVLDQRRVTTIAERKSDTEKIEQTLAGLAVQKVLSQTSFGYTVSKNVHVITTDVGDSGADRFNSFNKWYIKTRR